MITKILKISKEKRKNEGLFNKEKKTLKQPKTYEKMKMTKTTV